MNGLILTLTNTQSDKGFLIDDVFPAAQPEWLAQNLRPQMYLEKGVGKTWSAPFTDFVALSFSSGKIRGLIELSYVTASFSSTSDFLPRTVTVTLDAFGAIADNTAIGYVAIPEKATIIGIKYGVNVRTTVPAAPAVWTLAVAKGASTNLLSTSTADLTATVAAANTLYSATLTATAANLNVNAGDLIRLTSVSDSALLAVGGLTVQITYVLRA